MLLGTLDGEPSRTSNVQIQLQGVVFLNNSSPWYVPPPYSSASILSYKTSKTSLLAQTPPRPSQFKCHTLLLALATSPRCRQAGGVYVVIIGDTVDGALLTVTDFVFDGNVGGATGAVHIARGEGAESCRCGCWGRGF